MGNVKFCPDSDNISSLVNGPKTAIISGAVDKWFMISSVFATIPFVSYTNNRILLEIFGRSKNLLKPNRYDNPISLFEPESGSKTATVTGCLISSSDDVALNKYIIMPMRV